MMISVTVLHHQGPGLTGPYPENSRLWTPRLPAWDLLHAAISIDRGEKYGRQQSENLTLDELCLDDALESLDMEGECGERDIDNADPKGCRMSLAPHIRSQPGVAGEALYLLEGKREADCVRSAKWDAMHPSARWVQITMRQMRGLPGLQQMPAN